MYYYFLKSLWQKMILVSYRFHLTFLGSWYYIDDLLFFLYAFSYFCSIYLSSWTQLWVYPYLHNFLVLLCCPTFSRLSFLRLFLRVFTYGQCCLGRYGIGSSIFFLFFIAFSAPIYMLYLFASIIISSDFCHQEMIYHVPFSYSFFILLYVLYCKFKFMNNFVQIFNYLLNIYLILKIILSKYVFDIVNCKFWSTVSSVKERSRFEISLHYAYFSSLLIMSDK